jgi:hypothetical protein
MALICARKSRARLDPHGFPAFTTNHEFPSLQCRWWAVPNQETRNAAQTMAQFETKDLLDLIPTKA